MIYRGVFLHPHYNVDEVELHSGGEGSIHRIVGQPGLVAKIYHKARLGSSPTARNELKEKLIAMVNTPLQTQEDGNLLYAWPHDLLFSDNDPQFWGYVMLLVDDKQCEKWLQEQAVLFEREVRHTPEPVNKSITLAKYIDHWLTDVAPKKLAKTTYSRDRQDVWRILPALGHFKLTDLRKEVIRDFYEEMRKAPKLTDGKPLSEKSVEGIHNTLCSILSNAVEEGYLLHNPAWKMYKPQGEKKERPVADEELVQRLITALEGQSLKYETYFKLVLATGMRRGEACGLRWSDINRKKRSIHIQRNVVKLSHEPIFVKPPKTASGDRVVYISKEMAKLLKSWKQQCIWERKQNDEVLQEEDYLFCQPSGDPMVPTSFTFRFKKILRQNGLPENLNVHSLRHPYVKHTTKKYNSEKQKTQATKMDLIAWVFRFCTFNYSKRSWIL